MPGPRMPDLDALHALVAVARLGSLSAVAKEIGLTQQALSARIASLEALVGVRLTIRTTSGTRLTDAGALAVQWADELLHVAQRVEAAFATLRQETRSRMRISASLTIAEQLLPGWLVALQADARRRGTQAPDVVLVAANSDLVLQHVRSGQADLGFVEGPSIPRGIRSRTVAHDELVVVVRPDHPWARRRATVPVDELRSTPLVCREVGSGTRDFFTQALVSATAHRPLSPPTLEFSTTASVRAAVLAGAGPAVLSRLTVADDLAAGRLRVVPVALALRRPLRAVWTGSRTPPGGAVRDFLAHVALLTARPEQQPAATTPVPKQRL